MNKKISPTLIGVFVVGALALLVVAVIVFGSGQLFRHTKQFVIYFDSSVNGLRVGAPVKFKGVEVGSVVDIRLQLEENAQTTKIPVIIEIDLEKMTSRGASGRVALDPEAFHEAIIQRGLRAQLLMESLVTGLLYVGLDLFPETPVKLVQQPGGHYKYLEIPTTPTSLEQARDVLSQILAKLQEIDFKGLANSVTATVEGIDRLVNAPEIRSSLKALDRTIPKIDEALGQVSTVMKTLDGSVIRLTGNLEQTSDAARQAMLQADITLKQTDGALKEAEAALVSIRGMTDADSPLSYELQKSLREVTAAARSLRLLSGFVERNPRALVFGRPETPEGR
jgi:paraquat-inducible protein B